MRFFFVKTEQEVPPRECRRPQRSEIKMRRQREELNSRTRLSHHDANMLLLLLLLLLALLLILLSSSFLPPPSDSTHAVPWRSRSHILSKRGSKSLPNPQFLCIPAYSFAKSPISSQWCAPRGMLPPHAHRGPRRAASSEAMGVELDALSLVPCCARRLASGSACSVRVTFAESAC